MGGSTPQWEQCHKAENSLKQKKVDKININRVAISHSKYGIETVPEWSSLQAFNHHVAAISEQKDWQMYFPMEAIIKFKNPDGTLQCIELIRISRPYEITL